MVGLYKMGRSTLTPKICKWRLNKMGWDDQRDGTGQVISDAPKMYSPLNI